MTRLDGHLELTCAADAEGRSYLRHQSFSAPFHLSKPYCDNEVLVAQIANPTAGLFANDRLRSDVRVEPGARLHLTTPSASRVHTMRDGRAEAHQKFDIASQAWLDYFPAPLILQAGSRHRQVTQISTEDGAEVFFVETLVPGRVAHGESFAFAELDWEFDLRISHRFVARERFCLRPSDQSLSSWRSVYPAAYYASAWLLSNRVATDAGAWDSIRALNSEVVMLGVSSIAPRLWSLKLLAADGVSATKTLHAIRQHLAMEIPELRCVVRKL